MAKKKLITYGEVAKEIGIGFEDFRSLIIFYLPQRSFEKSEQISSDDLETFKANIIQKKWLISGVSRRRNEFLKIVSWAESSPPPPNQSPFSDQEDVKYLTLDIDIPEGMSDHEIADFIKDAIVRLDKTHRSLGGNGLKLRDLQALQVKLEDIMA